MYTLSSTVLNAPSLLATQASLHPGCQGVRREYWKVTIVMDLGLTPAETQRLRSKGMGSSVVNRVTETRFLPGSERTSLRPHGNCLVILHMLPVQGYVEIDTTRIRSTSRVADGEREGNIIRTHDGHAGSVCGRKHCEPLYPISLMSVRYT